MPSSLPILGPTAGFVLGAIVGSFLVTILVRWPRGQSVLTGRSHCDTCRAPLRPHELIPLVSAIVQRGRCRRCGAKIDPRQFALELAAAAVGLISALASPWPMALATALLGWWLLILAALDVEHQWLPDALTWPLIPAGLAVTWFELGPPLIDRAAGAIAGGLALWLIAWSYRALRGHDGMGGGDPKLAAGIGAWVGLFGLPLVLLGAGLVGLAAIAVLALRGHPVSHTTRLPLGALMAGPAWLVWLSADHVVPVTLRTLLTAP